MCVDAHHAFSGESRNVQSGRNRRTAISRFLLVGDVRASFDAPWNQPAFHSIAKALSREC